jgi:hypothetical protein
MPPGVSLLYDERAILAGPRRRDLARFILTTLATLLEGTPAMLLRRHEPSPNPARTQGRRTTVDTATNVTPRLVADLIVQSGLAPNATQAGQLRRLIEAEAWTGVALALIEIGLPDWKLVRAVLEDGEWSCALSRHWQVPEWLDERVEARHESLSLAMLTAFANALLVAKPTKLRVVPAIRPRPGDQFDPVCCDNFS